MIFNKFRPISTVAFLGAVFLVFVGCAGRPPYEDYTLAHTALEAAKAAQAPRVSPGYYSRADEYYHIAVVHFDERHYSRAKDEFEQARFFAEQAENYTVLKKAETGESN